METEVDLRLWRSFLILAEELHFHRAARRLDLTQPALSMQVRRLEAMLGTALLTRTSRHVELTPAGEVFLAEARTILASIGRAVETTRRAGAGGRRLIVGFLANAAGELTAPILNEFQERHRGLELDLHQFDFADPYAGLAEGHSDVAFVRPPLLPRPWLACETLFEEPRVLAVSSRNPLARRGQVTLDMLLDEPFVACRAPRYWRDFWLAADGRGGHAVRIGAEAATVDEYLEAVLLDRGVAFTQQSSERFYSRQGLSFVTVAGISPTAVAVAWRRDCASSLVSDFVGTARRVAVSNPCMPAITPADRSGTGAGFGVTRAPG